jgi:hypothetical protein
MGITTENLKHRFQFHPPRSNVTADKHDRVRSACLQAAEVLVKATGPASREQSTAITKLEEAMFWANAAIARGNPPS